MALRKMAKLDLTQRENLVNNVRGNYIKLLRLQKNAFVVVMQSISPQINWQSDGVGTRRVVLVLERSPFARAVVKV